MPVSGAAASVPVPRPQLASLTAARYVAALWVVAFHLLPIARESAPVQNLIGGGYIACSFFFVLSGFVLSYTYLDGEQRLTTTPGKFMLARLARIYPAYALALGALVLVMSWRGMLTWIGQTSPGALVLDLALAQAWLPTYASSWNFPGWSISVELAFYLSFPWLAAPVARMRGARALALMAMLWLLPLALDYAWCVAQPGAPEVLSGRWAASLHNAVRFFPLVRLPEFLLGVWIGARFGAQSREGERVRGGAMALSGIAVLAIAVTTLGPRPQPYAHTAYAPLFALIVYGLASWDRARRPSAIDRVMQILGDASYPLYLFQIPVALACGAYPPHSMARWALCLVVLHVVALGVSQAIELPLQRWRRRVRPT